MKKKILILLFGIFSFIYGNTQCSTYPTGNILYDASGTLALSTNNYNQDIYNVQSNLVIDGDVSFTNAVFIIEPGISITVTPGSSLTLSGCHLFGCATMWKGIEVQSIFDYNTKNTIYGTLKISKGLLNESSLIEDAEIAVKYSTGNKNATYYKNENLVEIDNTIFNKNFVSILMDHFDFMNPQIFTYPFERNPVSIKNTIFTCRDIPIDLSNLYIWVSINALKNSTIWQTTNYPNTPNVMTSPYITDALFSQTNLNSFLKAPYENEKSDIAIQLEGFEHKIQANFTIGEPTLNPATTDWNTNIFDNQRIGIYAHNCYAKIRNCTFQNLVNVSKTAFDATGVLAENNDEEDFFIDISSQNGEPRNAFFDCKYAVQATHYQSVVVNNCDIRSDNRNNIYGQNGINIQTWRVSNLEVAHNNISNITNGVVYRAIQLVKPIKYSTGGGQTPMGEVNVFNNTFNSQINGVTVANLKNLAIAINLEVETPVQWSICSGMGCSPNAVRCIENNISKYANGIRVSGFEYKNCRILNNNLQLGSGSNGLPQFGIKAEDCIAYNPNNRTTTNGNFIYNNRINGAPGVDNTGIDVSASNNFTINCNTTEGNIYGIKFTGDNTPNTNVYSNNIGRDMHEIALVSAGRIGQQGSPNFASDNQFIGVDGGSIFSMLCQQSYATNSPFYVQLGVVGLDPDLPVGSTKLIGSGNPYSQSNNSLRDATASNYPCSSISWKQSSASNNAAGYIGSAQYISNNIKDAEALVLGSLTMPAISQLQERLIVMKLQLYKSLLGANKAMATQSNILGNFVANPPQDFKQLQDVEEELAYNNIGKAKQLLANWQPTNIVAANYKQYYTWYMMDKPNLNELLAFAQQCPLTNGTAIYKARAMYNNLAHKNILFTNNCTDNSSPLTINHSPLTIDIYPNPTSNYAKIHCAGLKQIQVYNSFGSLIQTTTTLTDNYTLQTSKLPKGLYFIKGNTKNKQVATQKLIVE